MLWGETQFREVLTVNREGFIFIQEVGQVFVNGLNMNLLESKLFKVLSQAYASLNPYGQKATTFLDVSLGNLRPLRIQVLGEVAQPGAYTVSPSATLFSSLYYFNGPTNLGSLRDIRLIRGNKEIASIDFYDYLLTGKMPNDLKLQIDDIVFIPPRMKTVSISGEIKKPCIYELKKEETFIDIIKMAGNLKITAYLERAQIDRVVPFSKRDSLGMERVISDVDLKKVINKKSKFSLQDGDRINIFSIFQVRQNVVDIQGAISRPGTYDIGDSLRISTLIEKADGLTGDAYTEKIDLVRTNPDFTEQLVILNLEEVMNKNIDHDILLQGKDRLRVYGINEMVEKTYASVSGYVKFPGRYEIQKSMTLYDLIFLAGGFVDEEFKKNAFLERGEIIRTNKHNNDKKIIPFNLGLVLEKKDLAQILIIPEDQVRIYSLNEIKGEERFVTLNGNVKNPGTYELYQENMKLYDLLFLAGGFEDSEFYATVYPKRGDIIRFLDDKSTRQIIPFNLGRLIKEKNQADNHRLLPGDEVRIYPMSIFQSTMSIEIGGDVVNPGIYDWKPNMYLKDFILESGGLIDNNKKYLIDISRFDFDDEGGKYAKSMKSELERINVFNDDPSKLKANKNLDLVFSHNYKLEPYDFVSIRPYPYYGRNRKVFVDGSVTFPGTYTILSDEEKLSSLIQRSGGFLPEAFPFGSTFKRRGNVVQIDLEKIVRNPRSKENIVLQDGDSLIVAQKPKLIQIIGEVNAPGYYSFVKPVKLKKLILEAGGLNPNADKNNIYVNYPNGKSKQYRGVFRNPKVYDGSTITIGTKPEEEPFDKTEYLSELTSILANFAQAVSIILLATR